MAVLGLILVLVGLGLGGFVVAGAMPGEPGSDVSFSLFGLTVETSAVVVFALGAVTLLLLELGVLALRSGARKASRRRRELQRLRRVESEVQSRQSVESQRNASASGTASPPPFARRDPDRDTGSQPRAGRDPAVGGTGPQTTVGRDTGSKTAMAPGDDTGSRPTAPSTRPDSSPSEGSGTDSSPSDGSGTGGSGSTATDRS